MAVIHYFLLLMHIIYLGYSLSLNLNSSESGDMNLSHVPDKFETIYFYLGDKELSDDIHYFYEDPVEGVISCVVYWKNEDVNITISTNNHGTNTTIGGAKITDGVYISTTSLQFNMSEEEERLYTCKAFSSGNQTIIDSRTLIWTHSPGSFTIILIASLAALVLLISFLVILGFSLCKRAKTLQRHAERRKTDIVSYEDTSFDPEACTRTLKVLSVEDVTSLDRDIVSYEDTSFDPEACTRTLKEEVAYENVGAIVFFQRRVDTSLDKDTDNLIINIDTGALHSGSMTSIGNYITIPRDSCKPEDIEYIAAEAVDSAPSHQLIEEEALESFVQIGSFYLVLTPHGFKFKKNITITLLMPPTFLDGNPIIFIKDFENLEWYNLTESLNLEVHSNQVSYEVNKFSLHMLVNLSKECYDQLEHCISYLLNLFNGRKRIVYFRVQYRFHKNQNHSGHRTLQCFLTCTFKEDGEAFFNGQNINPDILSPWNGFSVSDRALVDDTNLEIYVGKNKVSERVLNFESCEKHGLVHCFDIEDYTATSFPPIDVKVRHPISGELYSVAQIIEKTLFGTHVSVEPEVEPDLTVAKIDNQLLQSSCPNRSETYPSINISTIEPESWRDHLHDSYVNWQTCLDPDQLKPYLIRDRIITEHETYVIETSDGRANKAETLLKILNTKSEPLFMKFLDILKETDRADLIPESLKETTVKTLDE